MSESADRLQLHPERIRFAITDGPAGSTPLDLWTRRPGPIDWILLGGAVFAITTLAAWRYLVTWNLGFDRVFHEYEFFMERVWLILGSLATVCAWRFAVRLTLVRESARLTPSLLIHGYRLGPFRRLLEFDLARIGRLRVGGREDDCGIDFDYDGATKRIGWCCWEEAQNALRILEPAVRTAQSARPADAPFCPPVPFSWKSFSVLALVGANLVPIVGVTMLGWNLGDVLLLYWAESAVIGIYNVLKMIRVGGCGATLPFFIIHYGGFMALHFAFTYAFFVAGAIDGSKQFVDVAAGFKELVAGQWPAILALFISHGISYWVNFLGRREFTRRTPKDQMFEPYLRVIIMHLTILLGAFVAKALGSNLPPLILLILLKIVVDVGSHRLERLRGRSSI